MTITLYNLFESGLLCVNAVAVLHEERFLAKIGWGGDQVRGFGEDPGVKMQIISLIRSVRTVTRTASLYARAVELLMAYRLRRIKAKEDSNFENEYPHMKSLSTHLLECGHHFVQTHLGLKKQTHTIRTRSASS